jgi:isopenicillin N synthase-like dioxygenase
MIPPYGHTLRFRGYNTCPYLNLGFFYIVNFGLSQEEVDRQFSIGKEIFKLPLEEKLKYRAELEKGGYNGYKPMGLRVS